MKIGVIQHRLRESGTADTAALLSAARRAADAGAEFVFMPEVPTLSGELNPDRRGLLLGLAGIDGRRLVPDIDPRAQGYAAVVDQVEGAEALGRLALFVGDACLEPREHIRVLGEGPSVVVLMPRSESDLQAEAVFELAIGLSESLAGLVIVVECAGAAPGFAGHGGSTIVLLGQVVAEAMSDDDVLIAEVATPVPSPEPREALPVLAPILQQRLAYHRGEKMQVDYPADLSS